MSRFTNHKTVLKEDVWLNGQSSTYDISELEDCAIGVDAVFFLRQLLDHAPAKEPLMPALGGLTGLEHHINENLDTWARFSITPFFVFDGQAVVGQEEVAIKRARDEFSQTDIGWELYSQGAAIDSVAAFSQTPGAFRVHHLVPTFQRILKARGLHFLVAPYNASAQLAHLEMIDSDQCAGIMGSKELLAYPIRDCIIQSLNWEAGNVTAIFKKRVTRALGIVEGMLIDALLMTGSSFLSTFPPLLDPSMYPNESSILEAVNILRTADKSVANASASFNDVLQAADPQWLDKYRKARLAIHHFIYITEAGEVEVNDLEHLTKDNHEYLGLQMPAELFHYLNTGLIGPRILNSITHGRILEPPTLDGATSIEYQKLVTHKIVPIREQTLGLMIPRVHRGIGHKDIVLKAWFDPKFSHVINHRSVQPPPSQLVATWDIKGKDLNAFIPPDVGSPIYRSVCGLAYADFVDKTFAKQKPIKGIDDTDAIMATALLRFLHLRGYVDDAHKLTKWGNALATTLIAINEEGIPRHRVQELDEAALLAFELIRHGLLDDKSTAKDVGGSAKLGNRDSSALVLITQCGTLLNLKHAPNGYTGALNKDLLAFRSLSTTVREADRDLLEAIVASMFMYGQCKRDRNDQLHISHSLPFLREPYLGLGIAVRTFFEQDDVSSSKETRASRLKSWPKQWLPLAEDVEQDFRTCFDFVRALSQGVETLDEKQLSPIEKAVWSNAVKFMDARPF